VNLAVDTGFVLSMMRRSSVVNAVRKSCGTTLPNNSWPPSAQMKLSNAIQTWPTSYRKGESMSTEIVRVRDLSFDDYDVKDGVSQSLMTTFDNCPRAFLYAINRYSLPSKTRQTGFGSMFHDVMDKTYTFANEHGEPPTNAHLTKWIELFVKNKKDQLIAKKDVEIELDKTICHVLSSFYIEYYESDFTQKRFKLIEHEFRGKYNGATLRGKIDAVYKCDGYWWLMEHKTKGHIDLPSLLLSLRFDRQLLFYSWALKNFHNIDIRGSLYNIVRNPQVRKKTTPSDLRRKLSGEVKRDPKHYFLRLEVPLFANEKNAFAKDLDWCLDDIRAVVNGERRCYRNRSACLRGFRPCEFLQACSQGTMEGYIQKKRLFEELSPT
jgi:hypothetical protein